jgi:CBS domain-containing protein
MNSTRPMLKSENAGELMTPNPLSIRESASVAEAIRFLTSKGFSAAPVIDDCGRPIGVVSRADILVFDRERVGPQGHSLYYGSPDLTVLDREPARLPDQADESRVGDIMTPVVFSVRPQTPAVEVAEEMVRLRVHRMFVVDDSGTLVGVVSALDMLRDLVD